MTTTPAVVSPFSDPSDAGEAGADRTVRCRLVASEFERDLHYRIRREVFCGEMGVFAEDDRDGHDADPLTRLVIGLCGQVAAGAVRLYPLDGEGLWQGDRLAVLPAFRKAGLGAPLVRFAVRTAGALGGSWMVAHVQPQNVAFFRRLGWEPVGSPETYVGLPHQQMRIRLA